MWWNCAVKIICAQEHGCKMHLSAQRPPTVDGCRWYCSRIWWRYYDMAKWLRLNSAQKYSIFTNCKLMNVTRGQEEIIEVAEWAISALNFPSPPSHNTMLRMLREEATTTAWMNSHRFDRKKKSSNRNSIFDEQLRQWIWKIWHCVYSLQKQLS